MGRMELKSTEPLPDSGAAEHLRLLAAVQRELCASGYAELSGIRCRLVAGRIVLSGTLSSYYLNQHALQAAMRVAGARSVGNNIQVVPRRPR